MKRPPVVEIFGPTIQGEGPDAGRPCCFVRFGGCDYQCSWCDSLHAVIPSEVRKAPRMYRADIMADLENCAAPLRGMTIVFSGGNPALHDLQELVDDLHIEGARVTVETQGTRWKDWIATADLVVVSPKPPSSLMRTDWNLLETFMNNLYLNAPTHEHALKIVVGDGDDYAYAQVAHNRFPTVPFYLSVLNAAGSDGSNFNLDDVLRSYRELCERVAHDPCMRDVKVMPQLHTLAWGSAKGV